MKSLHTHIVGLALFASSLHETKAALSPGEIAFYPNKNYGGTPFTISIFSFPQGKMNHLYRGIANSLSFQYNIPENTTVTLLGVNDCTKEDKSFQFIQNYGYQNIYQERKSVFDIVGEENGVADASDYFYSPRTATCDATGKTGSYMGINMIAWNPYDPVVGHFTVCEGKNFGGNCKNYIPSDFEQDDLYVMGEWEDQIQSIKLNKLNYYTQLSFYGGENGNGSPTYLQLYGNQSTSKINDLSDIGEDKTWNAFKWTYFNPLQSAGSDTNGTVPEKDAVLVGSASTVIDWKNHFDVGQTAKLSLGLTHEYSNSTETSRSVMHSWSVSNEITYTPPKATGGPTFGVTTSVSASDEQTKTQSKEDTITLSGSDTTLWSIPDRSHYVATLQYDFYSVAAYEVTSTQERWYDEYVKGAVSDDTVKDAYGFNTWYIKDQISAVTTGTAFYVSTASGTFIENL